jgi:hypothetical protein
MAIGNSWATGSWDASAWAANTWEDYGADPDGDETWDLVSPSVTSWTRVSPVAVDE